MKLSNSKKVGLFVGFSVVALGVGGGAFYYQKFMKASVEGADRTPQSKSGILIHHGQDMIDDVMAKTNQTRDMNKVLQDASMRKKDLRHVDFSGADGSGVNFQHSVFSSAKINSTKFEGAKMQGVRIVKEGEDPVSLVSFKNARLQFAEFDGDIIFEGADFSGARLHGARLYQLKFRTSRQPDGSVKHTDLSNAILQHASIHKWELHEVDGRFADFNSASMDGAVIIGGDFRGANFQGVRPLPSFQNVRIDDTTRFDEGVQDEVMKHVKRSLENGKIYLNYDPGQQR